MSPRHTYPTLGKRIDAWMVRHPVATDKMASAALAFFGCYCIWMLLDMVLPD